MGKSKIILFLLLLVLVGCDHSTLNVQDEFVPGEVAVKFTESVKKSEAKAFIEDLDLNPIDLSDLNNEKHPNWTLIGVPEAQKNFGSKNLTLIQ